MSPVMRFSQLTADAILRVIDAEGPRGAAASRIMHALITDPDVLAFHLGWLLGQGVLGTRTGACVPCGGKGTSPAPPSTLWPGYRPPAGGCKHCRGTGEVTYYARVEGPLH